MAKITELTNEQELKFEEFVEKWSIIGLSTVEININNVLEAVPQYYKEGGLEPPEYIIFCDSIWEAIEIGCSLMGDDKKSEKEKANYIWSSRVGMSLWVGWKARLDYMKYLGVDLQEYEPTWALAKECCYLFPFEKMLLVVRKPNQIFLNQNGDLNHESEMAISWPDGFGMYCLNGVRMCGCEWFFDKTLSDKEKAEKIFATENVEQRAEMLRVFGMSKIYETLSHTKLSSREDGYEVLAIDIGTGRKEEYLKMINPSTGEVHVEAVARETKTVEQALESRWPENMRRKYGYSEAKART